MILHINDRLNQWARWRLKAGGSSKSPYPIYNLPATREADDAPPPRSNVPINDLECCDTDKAYLALRPDYRQLVDEFYLRTGQSEDGMLMRLRMSRRTMYRRLDEVHARVMEHLNDLSCGIPVMPWGWMPENICRAPVDSVARNRYIPANVV